MAATLAKQLPSGVITIHGRHFGVDEAGRGAMAGPLSVAAVEWPWRDGDWATKLRDSKRISPRRRPEIAASIKANAKWACVMIDADWIDANGIQAAQALGLGEVVNTLATWDLPPQADFDYPPMVVCDGTPSTWHNKSEMLKPDIEKILHYMVNGDKYVSAVSAASIIAKETRDTWMKETAHRLFPNYGFAVHVGYVTEEHLATLAEFGSCDLHRHTFRPVRDRDALP